MNVISAIEQRANLACHIQ